MVLTNQDKEIDLMVDSRVFIFLKSQMNDSQQASRWYFLQQDLLQHLADLCAASGKNRVIKMKKERFRGEIVGL